MTILSVSKNFFQAQYPQTIKNSTNNSFVNSIYQYIHKKIGFLVLIAQNNPHHFTQGEGVFGHRKLMKWGGTHIQFKTADKVLINGMHFLGKGCTENSPTLILFNGNGMRYEEYGSQTLSSVRLFTVKQWLKLGVNVVLFNYRGIDNPGSATRDGLILDGDAAVQFVRDALNVPENKILLHGHSLGGGVASEVAKLHPQVNYCNDRSFSSLSQQAKMMYGGKVIGSLVSKALTAFGWEYHTLDNWKDIKGHKWIIVHPNDSVISKGAKLTDVIASVDNNATIVSMQSQWFKTKRGLRPEDTKLLEKPTQSDISFANGSAHMRKLHGIEEKSLSAEQIKIALTV